MYETKKSQWEIWNKVEIFAFLLSWFGVLTKTSKYRVPLVYIYMAVYQVKPHPASEIKIIPRVQIVNGRVK